MLIFLKKKIVVSKEEYSSIGFCDTLNLIHFKIKFESAPTILIDYNFLDSKIVTKNISALRNYFFLGFKIHSKKVNLKIELKTFEYTYKLSCGSFNGTIDEITVKRLYGNSNSKRIEFTLENELNIIDARIKVYSDF